MLIIVRLNFTFLIKVFLKKKENPLLNSDSVWKSHALYLVAEFFYSKGEKQKSKDFFEKAKDFNEKAKEFNEKAKDLVG